MFLSGVLFVLFLAGCWLYCLTDAALMPATEFRGFRKRVWVTIIAVTLVLGALAWVIARYVYRPARSIDALLAAEVALARHPASQAKQEGATIRAFPIGPDDDAEFLRMLADRIRDGY
jgi:hypothetical protein